MKASKMLLGQWHNVAIIGAAALFAFVLTWSLKCSSTCEPRTFYVWFGNSFVIFWLIFSLMIWLFNIIAERMLKKAKIEFDKLDPAKRKEIEDEYYKRTGKKIDMNKY